MHERTNRKREKDKEKEREKMCAAVNFLGQVEDDWEPDNWHITQRHIHHVQKQEQVPQNSGAIVNVSVL